MADITILRRRYLSLARKRSSSPNGIMEQIAWLEARLDDPGGLGDEMDSGGIQIESSSSEMSSKSGKFTFSVEDRMQAIQDALDILKQEPGSNPPFLDFDFTDYRR